MDTIIGTISMHTVETCLILTQCPHYWRVLLKFVLTRFHPLFIKVNLRVWRVDKCVSIVFYTLEEALSVSQPGGWHTLFPASSFTHSSC